jgi:hypothetical protein
MSELYSTPAQGITIGTFARVESGAKLVADDLPLNFHPAAFRASTNVTPFGAVSVPA